MLIGTSGYADPELADLPQVKANLSDLRDVLTARQGAGLPPAHCRQVLDPPGPKEVYSALTSAAAEAEDVLLVYYAGHGLTWTGRHELCLGLPGTAAEHAGPTALRYADVRQAVLGTRARIRVLILDCCFSGRAFERTLTRPSDALLSGADVDGAFVLTATEPNGLASATGERNTLFTGKLLRLLCDGVPDGPELLTLDFLFTQLYAIMKADNQPLPTCNNHNSAAHLALGRNRGSRRPDRLIEELRQAIGGLREAEDLARPVLGAVLDRFLDPDPPSLADAATLIDRQVDDVEARARRLGWTAALVDELKPLLDDCATARRAAEQCHDLARGRLGLREQLRNELVMFEAMAQRKRIAEMPEIRRRRREAHRLLWTKPCDLEAAQSALGIYARLVIDGEDMT